jgi:hypothetical protein
MCPQGNMQLLPEASDELGPPVRNDGLRHTMQAQYARNIQFNILLSHVEGVHRNVMSRLGKSVDDHPNGVKLAIGEGRLTMKFILLSSHFQAGIYSEIAAIQQASTMTLRHVSHYTTYRAVSRFIRVHQNCAVKS